LGFATELGSQVAMGTAAGAPFCNVTSMTAQLL